MEAEARLSGASSPLPPVGRSEWRRRAEAAIRLAYDFNPQVVNGGEAVGQASSDPGRWTQVEVAGRLDQTLLRPETTPDEMEAFLRASAEYPFAALCVQPCYVEMARHWLDTHRTGHSPQKVAAVVAFPQGAALTRSKVEETRAVVEAGADEIDMVANLGWLRAGEWERVGDEVAQVVTAARGRPVKVILECAALDRSAWAAGAAVAAAAGAAFVKTSTGFGPGGARPEDVALLRRVVGPKVGVKAAGGVRNWASVQQMIRAGADRIGTSHGLAILQECLRVASS